MQPTDDVITNTALMQVAYGATSPSSHQHVVTSTFDFESTLTHLKQAIIGHDLWLIHEINPTMLAERGGYAIALARQLLFFHPRYLARLLAVDPAAVTEIPLKFVVMQMPDASVTVRYCIVASLLGRYPGLEDLAGELDVLVRDVIAAISA